MAIAAGSAGGPGWTDILTAIGTVGAVIVAVGIALWTEWRSGKRIKAEHERSDKALREERERSAAELAEQREHGRKQLEEERRIAREREQLAQAYAVQVLLAQLPGHLVDDTATGKPLPATQLLLGIVNRSAYTIIRIETQFCLGRRMIPYLDISQLPSSNTPDALRTGPFPSPDPAMQRILTRFDGGLQFETDAILDRDLSAPYAMVRWTDHWGTRWEHRQGVVRQIADSLPWGQ
jgi:hypothetical protein